MHVGQQHAAGVIRENTHFKGEEVAVECRVEALAQEVADVTKADEKNVTEICGKEDIIWRVQLLDFLDLGAGLVLGGISVALIRAVSEFGMDCGEDLLRSGWYSGQGTVIVVVVEDGIL